ncbi:MAG: ZIP family metal transporter [Cyanobacteria bacterium NC_groundwater_1444_Ag_S-0.65um_54_12]|nr:ZIP family metal transporter [Cyanobacteria bacterium NC_groundwater_1444_Ag_S-0.65um_54_12]
MEAILIATIAAVFVIAGGALPLSKKEFAPRHLSWLVAFSAGIILSVGMLEMLGEAFEQIHNLALLWLGFGFIAMYLLERITIIHSCHDEDCERDAASDVRASRFVLWGIGFHSMMDGFALAISREFNSTPLMLMVALGVLFHSFPKGISLAGLMLCSEIRKLVAWRILAIIASLSVIGAILGMQIQNDWVLSLLRNLQVDQQAILGGALAFSAGNFIYIATGDLLPEAHRNRRDYIVPLSVILGFACNLATFLFFSHSRP